MKTRNCPMCNKIITYAENYSYDLACSRNTNCLKCSNLKWHNAKFGEKTITKFFSNCVKCGIQREHNTKPMSTTQVTSLAKKFSTRMCRSCAMKSRNIKPHYMETKPEILTRELLTTLGIEYKYQYRVFDGNLHKYFDFYIPSHNILLEVDGTYWHGKGKLVDELDSAQLRTHVNDIEKETMALNLGYKVRRIWQDEISLIKLREIINE